HHPARAAGIKMAQFAHTFAAQRNTRTACIVIDGRNDGERQTSERRSMPHDETDHKLFEFDRRESMISHFGNSATRLDRESSGMCEFVGRISSLNWVSFDSSARSLALNECTSRERYSDRSSFFKRLRDCNFEKKNCLFKSE